MDLPPVHSIADYAFLSDCRTAAFASRDGSIDWYCPRRFDAPSVFGRLLGREAGHWALRPAGPSRVTRSYQGPGLILRTEHTTADGRVAIIDALAQARGTKGHALGVDAPGVLLRRVEGLEGRVPVDLELIARPEYGLSSPRVLGDESRNGRVVMQSGPTELELLGPVPLEVQEDRVRATFEIEAGDAMCFALHDRATYGVPGPPQLEPDEYLDATTQAWDDWAAMHGRYRGVAKDQVERSAAMLQGLTYGPSGALLAAATTSLPERVGGSWNWDYRFAWLRDSGLIMRAQWVAACPDEPQRFFDWLARSIGSDRRRSTQIVFGVEGERRLDEAELPWLEGFRDSRPVRVGNGAWRQRQLDVMGEVLDIALLLREQLGEIQGPTAQLLTALANEAAKRWRDPDSGMWEARDKERHYLSSAVMCWVALDRALELGIGGGRDRARWRRERERIRSRVLDEGWNESVGAFTGAFDSPELDASVLLLPVVGFLPMDDGRMRATVEVIERELVSDGLVRRWSEDPNGFLICSYWLVECLSLGGHDARARAVFDRVTALANDLGLLSEMADLESGELLGNVPQAFSHAGLINAAWRLSREPG